MGGVGGRTRDRSAKAGSASDKQSVITGRERRAEQGNWFFRAGPGLRFPSLGGWWRDGSFRYVPRPPGSRRRPEGAALRICRQFVGGREDRRPAFPNGRRNCARRRSRRRWSQTRDRPKKHWPNGEWKITGLTPLFFFLFTFYRGVKNVQVTLLHSELTNWLSTTVSNATVIPSCVLVISVQSHTPVRCYTLLSRHVHW